MSRRSAREHAYKLIFGYLFTGEIDRTTPEIVADESTLSQADADYLTRVLDAVTQHKDEIDVLISHHAQNFKLDRIFKPDLAALTLACAEMAYLDDIPMSVSISEVVELVKAYSTEQSSVFVNGVLAGVYRALDAEKE